jgi:fructoselysine 6-kinase
MPGTKHLSSKGIRTVEVIDTTGAGDSFIAGFLPGRKGGLAQAESLALGRNVAAKTWTRVGGFPQEPAPL